VSIQGTLLKYSTPDEDGKIIVDASLHENKSDSARMLINDTIDLFTIDALEMPYHISQKKCIAVAKYNK
jgi:hypothetical protein